MTIRIPAEWEPHACCWMAWAVHPEWADWTEDVKAELDEIVRVISQFEPVRLLTPATELDDALARFAGGNVEIVEAPVDDIWMRDIAPSFALRGNQVVAIDWNFNSWGGTKKRPVRQGDRIASAVPSVFEVPRLSVSFVAEGGALITDGQGNLVTTRSCLLSPTRNPVRGSENRERIIERDLMRLGIHHVIWLEGDPCEPGTNGHVDGYVLFKAPGAVLVEVSDDKQVEPAMWRAHDIALLENAKDVAGNLFDVEQVRSPRKRWWRFKGHNFAASYLNAYIANGAVITARFGDNERDDEAMNILEKAFPQRKIIMLRIDHIAGGGGGVHCLTQPMPITVGR